MRVLIIGGTGFIGAHVVRRLVEDEHQVTLFHRGHTKADLPATVSHLHGAAAGWEGEVKSIPGTLLPRHLAEPYDWTHNLAADTNRIRRELSYQERIDRGEALRRTLAWERASQWRDFDVKRFNYAAEDEALCTWS